MRRVQVAAVCAWLCLAAAGALEVVNAWHFGLQSDFRWEYRMYAQLGANGFFGPFDTDNSDGGLGYGGSPGSAASMNGWLGREIGQISSGSDLAMLRMRMDIFPEFRLNEAIRIRGSYRIGSWADPMAPTSQGELVQSMYADTRSPGIARSFSPGYWNTLWVSAHTPWGIVVVGKRPGPFGMGLIADGADNADAVGILLMTNYGPLRLGVGLAPWMRASEEYYAQADKNAIRPVELAAGVTYDEGPVSVGAVVRHFTFRRGPEAMPFQGVDGPFPTGRYGLIPSDTNVVWGTIYMKFNNGRLFFNGEFALVRGLTRNQRWLSSNSGLLPDGSFRSLFAPWYVESERCAAEFGAYAGPFKVSLLWAWLGGSDRRHGVRIDRQGDFRFVHQLSNVSVFLPYSYLLSYSYGGGNNTFALDSNHGYMTDANVYAARVDYSLASNLNLYGSFLWADRVSNGYGWGFIRPEYSIPTARFTGRVEYNEMDRFAEDVPNIPDRNLGYEIDWGFGWKLLENYTLRGTFGVWRPGKWFSYACVDRSVYGWKTPGPGNFFGTNPNRSVNAVFAFEAALTVDF